MDRTDRIVIAVWVVLAASLTWAVFQFVGQLLAVGHFYSVLQNG